MSDIFNSIKVLQEVKDEVDKVFTDIENTYQLCQRIINKKKMKLQLQLIMLKDPIIVSDGEIKDKDWFIDMRDFPDIYDEDFYCAGSGGSSEFANSIGKKIIAGIPKLPQIDWNGLEAKFGYVDLKQLSWKETNKLAYSGPHADRSSECFIWTHGFKKAQELNDKKFSLEDMDYAYLCGINDGEINVGNKKKQRESFLQSISQPKVFDIEVEMEMKGVGCEAYRCNHPLDPEEWNCDSKECEDDCKMLEFIPKVTEGKIKITKKL